MSNFTKEEMKKIVKEAIHSWMDDKFASFGKWSAAGIAIAALGLFAYLFLRVNGWIKISELKLTHTVTAIS